MQSSFHLSSAVGLIQGLDSEAFDFPAELLEKLANSLLRLNEQEFRHVLEGVRQKFPDLSQLQHNGSGLIHYLCHAGVSVDPALLKAFTWMVPALTKAGAPLEQANHRSYAPVHMAAILSRPDPLRALLKEGAALEVSCRRGRTPLFYANATTLPELLKAGANVHHLDHAGGNALWAVAEHEPKEALQKLLKAGASADPAFMGEAKVPAPIQEMLRTVFHDQKLQHAAPARGIRKARM